MSACRVKKTTDKFLSTLLKYDQQNLSKLLIESNCLDMKNTNILRAEFYCVVDSLYEDYDNNDYLNKIPKELFFIPCEDLGTQMFLKRVSNRRISSNY